MKCIGISALVYYKNKLLILETPKSPEWHLPGGTLEPEESPLEELVREIKEDFALTIQPTKLLSVDYVSHCDSRGESLQLLFAAKDLTEEQITRIEICHRKVKNFRFVSPEIALQSLAKPVATRLSSTWKLKDFPEAGIYLENGKPVVYDFKLAMAFR
jgi:ADP-ribose pyrophosphatase YjhB (NUDIX family)